MRRRLIRRLSYLPIFFWLLFILYASFIPPGFIWTYIIFYLIIFLALLNSLLVFFQLPQSVYRTLFVIALIYLIQQDLATHLHIFLLLGTLILHEIYFSR